MQIIRLKDRMIVLVEEGEVRLAQLPTGVFYKPSCKAWGVQFPGTNGWESTTFSVKRGLIASFDEAVRYREEKLGVLVKKRLISRYLAGYKGNLRKDGYFYVSDPITGQVRRFETKDGAESYNWKVLDQWLDEYQIPYDEIYKEIRHVGNEHTASQGKAAKNLLEKARAESAAHHHIQ